MCDCRPSPPPLALRAEPSAGGEAGYLPLLQRANPEILPSEAVFLFHPGMLFGSRERWWGNPAPRPTPHEGLDLWRWEDEAAQVYTLPVTFRVPALLPGVVARLIPDFLGLTVCLRAMSCARMRPASTASWAISGPGPMCRQGGRSRRGKF